MPRYKLVIEYDGAPFRGWQRQADDPTVQAAIETAVTRFSGETARLTCAGRTDAGVHAIHQVAHLDLAKDWRTDTVRDALNAHLRPQPVSILSAEVVPQEFDARHSAIRRPRRRAAGESPDGLEPGPAGAPAERARRRPPPPDMRDGRTHSPGRQA